MSGELRTKEQKRPRRCFFYFHNWGAWGDRAQGVRRYAGKVQGQLVIQERRCTKCNAIDLRTVYS